MGAPKTAGDRLRARIRARLEDERDKPRLLRRTQQGLAKAMGISPGSLSELLDSNPKAPRERGLLENLDTVAKYLGMPPSFFVHRDDTSVVELQNDEPRLITYWRQLPAYIQQGLMDTLTYVAGLLPEEREQRRWWVKIRRIADPARRAEVEQLIDDILRKQPPVTSRRIWSVGKVSSRARERSRRAMLPKA